MARCVSFIGFIAGSQLRLEKAVGSRGSGSMDGRERYQKRPGIPDLPPLQPSVPKTHLINLNLNTVDLSPKCGRF
jgi:hypothetical protein